MKAIQDMLRRVDRFQKACPPLAFLYGVIKKFGDDHAGYLAALIAYYAFFSLFPLLLVGVTILGYVLSGNDIQRIDAAIGNRIPVIGGFLGPNAPRLHGSGIALAIGLVLTLLGGIAVIQAFHHAMDEVWGVPLPKRPNYLGFRVRALIMLGVLGVATLAASAVTGLGHFMGSIASGAVNIAIVIVAFKVLTSAEISWADVAPGAVAAGIALTGLQVLGSYYVTHHLKHASLVYGQFAVVIGLLSWLYLGAQITIYAAEINVVRVKHLWPRSLVEEPTTGDREVLEPRARVEQPRPDETIRVSFEKPATNP